MNAKTEFAFAGKSGHFPGVFLIEDWRGSLKTNLIALGKESTVSNYN
jgi:hypothetical protein